MCLSCGCGRPNDQHGRSGDITYADLVTAANNEKITPAKALANMDKTFKGNPEGKTTGMDVGLDYWHTQLELKTVNISERTISAYAAIHHTVDRVRDVIDPSASVKAMRRLTDPSKQVGVFIGHDSSKLSVGYPKRMEVTPKGLYTETYVWKGPDGDNLLAVAADMFAHGHQMGASIGYKTVDSHHERNGTKMVRRLMDYDLKEYSFAAPQVIAHPEALVESVKVRRGQKALTEGSDTAGGALVPADRPDGQNAPSRKAVKGMQYRVNAVSSGGPWEVICDGDADGDADDNRTVGTYASEEVANAVALALRQEALEDNEDGPDEDTAPDAGAEGEIMSTQDKTVAARTGVPERKAEWSTAMVNDLPDSAFLYVEPGGQKDDTGKTVPRSKRHLPYKNASGAIDKPHLRNAIARIPQMDGIDDAKKAQLQARARRMLGKADDGKTYQEAEEWKTGAPISVFGLSCRLADVAEKIATAHQAMSVLGEDTKSFQRIPAELREELVAIFHDGEKIVEWAGTIEAGADAAARLAWHRQQLALASL